MYVTLGYPIPIDCPSNTESKIFVHIPEAVGSEIVDSFFISFNGLNDLTT